MRKLLFFFMILSLAQSTLCRAHEPGTVDFRYSPPWWQTAVCFPDDPDKILVGREGQFLFDYGRGSEKARRFGLCLQPDLDGGLTWRRQETLSARVPVVRTLKDAAGVEVMEEAFVAVPDGFSPAVAGRQPVILLTLKNTGPAGIAPRPVLHIQSIDPVEFVAADNMVIAGRTRITASEPIVSLTAAPGRSFVAALAPVPLAPGASRRTAFFINRGNGLAGRPCDAGSALAARDETIQWWKNADLPYSAIQVPDPEIQSMLDSCVRNIWQAREIKDGKPAFHVGPTCYRGLWIVDGAFILESAALVGRAMEARAGIEYMLGHQKPDGSFELIDRYWKENGIVLWAVTRHAFLTSDKVWLASVWPKLEKVVDAIIRLRERSRSEDPGLDDGLMPTGFTDGGISGDNPEYSNTYWTLAGLKAAAGAAEWLGRKEQAVEWSREYDDFMKTFRTTAERDMTADVHGNRYLPVIMGSTGREHLPQRGQWAFLHAVYPGQVFARDDPLVRGNMAMLGAVKKQGLIFGTGWDSEGIWTYAAGFYGHALLWQGNGRDAARVLYDYANHACPTRVWREEQRPVGQAGHDVGDMPHNWASAEFIRLAVHLIQIDRGNELHLLEGFPRAWSGPGMTTRLSNVATPFGPLSLVLRVNGDGKEASLNVEPLSRNCTAIVVHLPDGTCSRLPPDRAAELHFPVTPPALSR